MFNNNCGGDPRDTPLYSDFPPRPPTPAPQAGFPSPPPSAVFPTRNSESVASPPSGAGLSYSAPRNEGRIEIQEGAMPHTREANHFPFPPAGTVFKRHPPKQLGKQSAPPQLSQQIEFVKGSPLYTKQLIILFGASFFGIVPLLSYFSVATFLCCVVVTYMLDYLGFTRSTIAALLATALLFSAALLLTNLHAASTSIGPIFMILDFGGLLMLATAAAALHFRYLQENYPELICVLDRLVMGLAPILALPSLLTSIIALGGSRRAPLWFLLVMCTESYFFYQPINSSFTCLRRVVAGVEEVAGLNPRKHEPEKGKVSSNSTRAEENVDEDSTEEIDLVPIQLNERTESVIFTILLLTLPIAVYTTLQSDFSDNLTSNLFNCFGLLCSGLGYLCAFPAQTFWFLAPEQTSNGEDVYHRLVYDPYGLEDLIRTHRSKIVVAVCVSVINWTAYRLVHCRYRYLLDGVPYPYNFFVLLVAMYTSLYVVFQTKRLLDADAAGKTHEVKHHTMKRVFIVFGAVVVTLLGCLLMNTPGIFYLLGGLSVVGFNTFLLDRSAPGPMFCFIIFSSFLLLWWMYRTFSFIVLDLHVLGSSLIVSTSAVAASVLFSYTLGWVSFAFSFQSNSILLMVFLVLHAMEISFVEEVLYSQKEEGSYPAVLVGLTSGVGIFMAWRLFKNEVLTATPVAFLASMYVAKGFVFLVEVTGSYYKDDVKWSPSISTISAIEINAGWWVFLFAGYIVAIFEIEGKRGNRLKNVQLLSYSYLVAAGLLSLLTIRNLQRAVYEFVTRSYVGINELPHIALGMGLLMFSFLTQLFFSRHSSRYHHLLGMLSTVRFAGVVGALLLAVQPTRIIERHGLSSDHGLHYADKGRYATVFGIFCLIAGCYAPLPRLPGVVRGLYWAGAALALAFGITTTLLPISTWPLFCTIAGVVFFDLVVLDLAHYRQLQSMEILFFYGLSACGIVASFFALGRVKLLQVTRGDEPLVLLLHEEGRSRFLSIMAVINLFLVILLRARLSEQPLLPGCTPLKPLIINQVSVLCNSAILLTVSILYLLNFLCNNGEPGFYTSCSLLLALLVSDGKTIDNARRVQLSYFLIISSALAVLWLSFLSEIWEASKSFFGAITSISRALVIFLPLIITQVSLLARLWQNRGSRRTHFKNSSLGYMVAFVTVIINTLTLLLTSCKAVQWMCTVAICGEATLVIGNRLLNLKM